MEERAGPLGVVFAYLLCGVLANVVSQVVVRGHIVSLGASGAVFGLFVTATLATIQPDLRSILECFVLGQFALSQVWAEIAGPARAGVDTTALMIIMIIIMIIMIIMLIHLIRIIIVIIVILMIIILVLMIVLIMTMIIMIMIMMTLI